MHCTSLRMLVVTMAVVGFSLLSLTHADCPPVPSCAAPPAFVWGLIPARGTVVKKTVQLVIDDAPGTAHDLYLNFNADADNCYGENNQKFPAGCEQCTNTEVCPAGSNGWACKLRYTSPNPLTVELEQTYGVCHSHFSVAVDVLPSQTCNHAQVEFNLLDAGLVADWNDISLVNGYDRPVTLKSNGLFGSVEVTGKYSGGMNIYPLYCDCGFAQNYPPCNQSDFRPCPCYPPVVPQAAILPNGEVVNYVVHWPSNTAKR